MAIEQSQLGSPNPMKRRVGGTVEVPYFRQDFNAGFISQVLLDAGMLDCEVRGVTIEALGTARGFACDLFRVIPDYSQPTAAPRSMVAKLPSRTPEAEALAHALDLWNVESIAYRDVLPNLGIRVPRCWYNGADPDRDRYALLLEDLSAMTPVDQIEGIDEGLMSRTIDWMTGLHGRFWGRGDDLADLPTCARSDQMIAAAIGAFVPAYADRFAEILPAGSITRVENLIDGFGAGALAAGSAPTVIHGDLRGDNLMFDADSVVAVDWQGAKRGPGLRDVAYVMTSSFDAQQRRDAEQSLISRYRTGLAATGTDPGSFDDVWQAYRLGVAASMMIQVLAAGQLHGADERSLRLLEMGGIRVFTAAADLGIDEGIVE